MKIEGKKLTNELNGHTEEYEPQEGDLFSVVIAQDKETGEDKVCFGYIIPEEFYEVGEDITYPDGSAGKSIKLDDIVFGALENVFGVSQGMPSPQDLLAMLFGGEDNEEEEESDGSEDA